MEDAILKKSQQLLEEGNIPEALKCLSHALEGAVKDNNHHLEGLYCWEIANCFQAMGDHSSTINYFEKSLRIFQKLGDTEKQISLFFNIATAYQKKGDYQQSIIYAEKAKENSCGITTDLFEGLIRSILASSYWRLKKYEKAAEYSKETIKYFKKETEQFFLIKEIETLLQIAHDSGDVVIAISSYNFLIIVNNPLNKNIDGHRLLNEMFNRKPTLEELRMYIESDLGEDNSKIFSALWELKDIADGYKNFFVQEYIQSLAGITSLAETYYINDFNMDLLSDFFRLMDLTIDEDFFSSKGWTEFTSRHHTYLTYWRIRDFGNLAYSRRDSSEQFSANALKICSYLSRDNPKLSAYIGYINGKLDLINKRYSQARQNLDDSLLFFKENEMQSDYCLALLELSQLYFESREVEDGFDQLNQCLTIAKKLKDLNLIETCLRKKGLMHHELSQNENAIECFSELFGIVSKQGDDDQSVATLIVLTRLSHSLNDHPQAVHYFQEILKYQDKNLTEKTLNSLMNMSGRLGWDYIQLKKEDVAIDFLEKALALSKTLSEKGSELSCLDCLGLAHCNLAQFEKAIPYYQDAFYLAKKIGENDKAIDYISNMGNVYHKINLQNTGYENKKEFTRSIDAFKESKPLLDECGKNDLKQSIQLNLLHTISNFKDDEYKKSMKQSLKDRDQENVLHFPDSDFMILMNLHKLKGTDQSKGAKTDVFLVSKVDESNVVYVMKTVNVGSRGDWNFVQKFIQEAEIWLELKHPNIVELHSIREINRQIYLCLEMVIGPGNENSDLSHWIGTSYLNFENCLKFAIHICDGLDYAYKKFKEKRVDFAHLDLKPPNILISKDEVAKVTDFGISKLIYSIKSSGHMDDGELETPEKISILGGEDIAGTWGYMSPEQWKKFKDIDIRSDIYSFGCLFFEMLTGHEIFNAWDEKTYAHLHVRRIPDLSKLNRFQHKDALTQIIGKCCEKDRSERYQNFGELRQALNELIKRKKVLTIPAVGERTPDIGSLINKGVSLVQLHQYQKAIECFDQALEINRNEKSAWMNKGIALKKKKSINDALYCIDKSLKIDPDYTNALVVRGDILAIQGKTDKALACYDRSLDIDPNQPIGWNNKGNLLARTGKYFEALRSHENAIGLKPNYINALIGKCSDLLCLHKLNHAFECFKEIKKLSPNHQGIKKFESIFSSFPNE